jgi:hypothetical protein
MTPNCGRGLRGCCVPDGCQRPLADLALDWELQLISQEYHTHGVVVN